MDGIHDMGGVEGYGPIDYHPEERAQVSSRWEAVAGAGLFALMRAGVTNIDAFRHRIERLDPRRYLAITYWGRWLAAIESATVEQGVASVDDIETEIRRRGHHPTQSAAPPVLHPVAALESRHNAPGFRRTVDRDARFAVGDTVRCVDHAPQSGHHRLPRYVRGREGAVVRVYPAFTFPDTMAHGGGEHPCHVYAVRFRATDLWGPDADPAQYDHLDVFEPYLLPG